jgi:VWFA-related protein
MAARVAGCLLILSAFGTRPALVAQGPKPDSSQILHSFRLVATGANGQPVVDLRPEEIQVSDDSKRYPLAFVRLLRTAPLASLGSEPRLGPREFSNRGAGVLSASTLILIDLLNANITERGATWNEVNQSLGGMESADNVFLFLLTPDANLFPVHAWQPPDAPKETSSEPWTRRVRQLLDQSLREVERIKPLDLTAAPGLTAEPTYRALSILANQYAALPGQKRMIWITHGIPLTVLGPDGTVYMDFNPLLKQTGAQFSRLGIALYTVHQVDRSTAGVNSQETLQGLPPLTGGRWFENDAVGPAISQAQMDARATYQAAYYAPAQSVDGKFHKLRVSTTRKGVKILAEEGYTATAPEEIANSNLELVGSRPFDTPDIGLRAAVASEGKNTRLQIHADPRDLLLQHGGNTYTGAISLVFIYYNADGTQNASPPVTTNISLTQEQLDAAMKDGYLFNADANVPSGTRKLRLIIQDTATGIAGSLTLPLGADAPKP